MKFALMIRTAGMYQVMRQGAGEGTGAGGEADQAAAAAGGDKAPDTGAEGAKQAPWWQDQRFSEEQRGHLTAKGLTIDDPMDAMVKLADMHRHAETRIGKGLDKIMDRPAKDQPVAEFMRANREVFGLPEAAEGYEISRPESWPKDAAWDTGFETEVRKIAFDNGVPPAALNAMVQAYAGKMLALQTDADQGYEAANAKMMGDLQKEWGDQAPARIAMAQQMVQLAAEKAGLGMDEVQLAIKAVAGKVGDASAIRIFATLGQLSGDDQMIGLGNGARNMGTTPAEARQQLAQLQAEGGAYYEAVKSGNTARIAELGPKIEQLSKLATGGK